MDSMTSNTFEPSLADITFNSSLLFTNGFICLCYTLVSFQIPTSSEHSPTFFTCHSFTDRFCPLAPLPLATDWDCWLSGLLQVCTAKPPLLLNHLSHVSHFITPSCSFTGFCLSSMHLCRALSHSLRNLLWHTMHTTFFTESDLRHICCWNILKPWSLASFHLFLSNAYHTSHSLRCPWQLNPSLSGFSISSLATVWACLW